MWISIHPHLLPYCGIETIISGVFRHSDMDVILYFGSLGYCILQLNFKKHVHTIPRAQPCLTVDTSSNSSMDSILPCLLLIIKSWALTLSEASDAYSSDDSHLGCFHFLDVNPHSRNFGRPDTLLGFLHLEIMPHTMVCSSPRI